MFIQQIPYIGRAKAKKPTHLIEQHWTYVDEMNDVREVMPNCPYNKRGWESFYCEHSVIRFGETDFVINESFDQCSSHLESSFGCAFRKPCHPDNVLAGQKNFKIDKFEVFLVSSSNAYSSGDAGYPGSPGGYQYQ